MMRFHSASVIYQLDVNYYNIFFIISRHVNIILYFPLYLILKELLILQFLFDMLLIKIIMQFIL